MIFILTIYVFFNCFVLLVCESVCKLRTILKKTEMHFFLLFNHLSQIFNALSCDTL